MGDFFFFLYQIHFFFLLATSTTGGGDKYHGSIGAHKKKILILASIRTSIKSMLIETEDLENSLQLA